MTSAVGSLSGGVILAHPGFMALGVTDAPLLLVPLGALALQALSNYSKPQSASNERPSSTKSCQRHCSHGIPLICVLISWILHLSSPLGVFWAPGFVVLAEGFNPVGRVQHLIDQYSTPFICYRFDSRSEQMPCGYVLCWE
jgi:hypothetical protein